MMKEWMCSKCGHRVKSELIPNSRYEPVITHEVGHNEFEGRDNPDTQRAAGHYGCVCFGPDRGEDYFEHCWSEVEKVSWKEAKELLF